MASNNGGPAFPIVVPGFLYGDGSCDAPLVSDQGMTLRQWYKGLALQGIMAQKNHTPEYAAVYAGRCADAMLAEDKEFEERKEATP